MNFLRNAHFAKTPDVLHSKLQDTHIVHVLGGERFVRPERNVKGVSSHADGSQEESQEESRQEEDQEGEEEEVTRRRLGRRRRFGRIRSDDRIRLLRRQRPRRGMRIRPHSRGQARPNISRTARKRGFFVAAARPLFRTRIDIRTSPPILNGV